MKFVYKNTTYNTEFMSEKDKELLKDVIQAAERKLKVQEMISEKSENETVKKNKLPFDRNYK